MPSAVPRSLGRGIETQVPEMAAHVTPELELGWSCLFVRHASAGRSSIWPGADRDRPLDDLGRAQASALVSVLEAHGVVRLVSADLRRCLDTLAAYAVKRRIVI